MSLRSEHRLPSANRAKTRRPPDSSAAELHEALVTQNAVCPYRGPVGGDARTGQGFLEGLQSGNRRAHAQPPDDGDHVLLLPARRGAARAREPDSWALDQVLFDRPGDAEIQFDLLHDYRNNSRRSTE